VSAWNDDKPRYNAYRKEWRRQRKFNPGDARCKCHASVKTLRGPFRANAKESRESKSGLVWTWVCTRCWSYAKNATEGDVRAHQREIGHGRIRKTSSSR
jgi:hypothetical protein